MGSLEALTMTQKEANQLNEAKAAVLAQWKKACFTQGIPADSKFVIFAKINADATEHNRLMGEFFKLRNRIARNAARRERHAAMKDLGLKRVVGAQGGVYYE
jgi:hypothetical protein